MHRVIQEQTTSKLCFTEILPLDEITDFSDCHILNPYFDATIPIKKRDYLIFKNVYNVANCNENINVTNKFTPPNKKQTYCGIVNADAVEQLSCVYVDSLTPWNSLTKKPQYSYCSLVKIQKQWKSYKTLKHGAQYSAIRPKFAIKKVVYSSTFPRENIPSCGTTTVVVYDIHESVKIQPLPDFVRLKCDAAGEIPLQERIN